MERQSLTKEHDIPNGILPRCIIPYKLYKYPHTFAISHEVGLTDAKWENKEEEERELGRPHRLKQRPLSDFLGQSSTS